MARMAVIVLILGICLPEALQAGVVLEAGEIDSSKVRVGVFAEVVYGKGKRDPVSGEWENLVMARGYIKAVDAERLTLAVGEGALKEQIAFARIQKLIIAEPSRGILEAGEIHSSKVRVGVFAEVVYGKGKRDPVSGQWEKLGRARGYIEAVDAEGLTLGGSFRKKRIAFARIQKLLLAKSSREMARLRESANLRSLRTERITSKLVAGAGIGAGLGLLGGAVTGGIHCGKDPANCDDDLEGVEYYFWGAVIGYVVGVSGGVSMVDRHDRFIASLVGGLIGGGVGHRLTIQQEDLWPSLLICPLVGAVTMSELTRDASFEARRLSVGLAPGPKGSVSALATLRF